jgi:hypothetical protein
MRALAPARVPVFLCTLSAVLAIATSATGRWPGDHLRGISGAVVDRVNVPMTRSCSTAGQRISNNLQLRGAGDAGGMPYYLVVQRSTVDVVEMRVRRIHSLSIPEGLATGDMIDNLFRPQML